MKSRDFVVVATFTDRATAEVAKSVLDAAGIDSVIGSDDMGGLRPAMAFTRGVELLVVAHDAQRARELLK